MAAYGLPVIATLALWWASTGAILYLDGLPRRTFALSMAGATALVALAFWALVATSGQTTLASAYVAFASGVVVWGWQLMSFYMGYVTGPRKTALPAGYTGWRRFVEAARTSLYHEIAAFAGAVLMFALTADQPNHIGAWTYVVLWWMHQSAKFNVFFGAPNLGEEMLPEHLRYLVSYMRRRPMNLFFPFSVTASTIATVLLAQKAWGAATPFDAAGFTMLTTLMVLAIAEHWFLVAPLNGNALWGRGAKETAGKFAPLDLDDALAIRGSMLAEMESWSPAAPAVCDARRLHRVLESIGTGAYGEVDCIRGVVKTNANWISFELAGQRPSMAPYAPQRLQEPLVVAMGRRFDRVRLQAAFDACAAMS